MVAQRGHSAAGLAPDSKKWDSTGLVWASCEVLGACVSALWKVSLIGFLMLLSIIYNNECAAVHQQMV